MTCHTLPGKKEIPDIVLRVTNRKTKVTLLRNAKLLKGTRVFFNEHLTRRNAQIAREARRLKREKKIISTWTRNCKVFIKTLGTPETSQVRHIQSLEDLQNYCY